MSPERFDALLTMVKPWVEKKDTSFRQAIPGDKRLALTLRFLASGDSQQSLSFSYRIGKATVSKIVSETCEVIFDVLKKTTYYHLEMLQIGSTYLRNFIKPGICLMSLGVSTVSMSELNAQNGLAHFTITAKASLV